MSTIIDLGSEVLIDRSRVRNPYLRLLLAALGQELTQGSPWVAIDVEIASKHEPLLPLLYGQLDQAAA